MYSLPIVYVGSVGMLCYTGDYKIAGSYAALGGSPRNGHKRGFGNGRLVVCRPVSVSPRMAIY